MAQKYALYIDYRATANHPTGYEYMGIEANDLLEAIEVADRKFDKETMYLVKILQKGKQVTTIEGEYRNDYHAVLCNRSNGWHQNNLRNGESALNVGLFSDKKKTYSYWQIL